MSFRSDPLDRLVVPDGTTAEEHSLVAAGDVVVGGQSSIEFGVRGRNVIAGERVRFGGDIEAEGDCRLDMWCDVAGNVLVGEDAYLGERVHVEGQLMVSNDLDIGDDVDIEEGFEANGWIVIRNPMPTIVFLFVYLSQLLRIGEEEAAEELWDEMAETDREHDPVLVPRSSRVSDDAWRVSTPAEIGDDCRLNGNVRAERMTVGEGTEIYGSLRAKGDVAVGRGTVVHGDVTTRGGAVRVERDAEIRGDVSCEDLRIDESAEVDGAIRARGEMAFVDTDPRADDGDASADRRAYEPAVVRIDDGDETEDEYEPAIVRIDDADAADVSGGEAGVDAEAAETEDEDADAEDSDGDETGDGAEEPEPVVTTVGENVTIPDAEGDPTNGDVPEQDGLAGALAEAEER